MSALIENPQVSGSQASPGSEGNSVGNSMTQITVGAAALASKALYEIMALFAEIIRLDQEQKIKMIDAQKEEGLAQAKATKAAGRATKIAMYVSGALLAAGALAGAGIYAGMMSKGDAGQAGKEMNSLSDEMKPMKEVEGSMKLSAKNVGASTPDEPIEDTPLVQAFKAGDYSDAHKDPKATEDALVNMRAQGTNGHYDFDGFEKRLNDRYTRKTAELNSWSNKYNVASGTAQLVKGLTDSLSQSGGKMAEGQGQGKSSMKKAKADLNGSANQLAASSANEFGSGANSAEQSMGAVMTSYKEMINNNGANA